MNSIDPQAHAAKAKKAMLLIALYSAQGLPYGFFTQALPVFLRKANTSLAIIGLSSLLALPWAMKFLWAPAVDRLHWKSMGLRRSWLLPLQGASILVYLALSGFDLREHLPLVLAAFFASNLIAAAQDVATDGLAIDLLTPNDRGWANGIQVAAYRLGMIVGGGAILYLFEVLDWSGSMFALAGLTLLCTLPVIAHRERPREVLSPPKRLGEAAREVFHFFSQPGAKHWLCVLLLFKAGHAGATTLLRPWLVDRGHSMTEIAALIGSMAFLPGMLGALFGGALLSWASRWKPVGRISWRSRLLVALGVLQSFAVCSYLLPIFGLTGSPGGLAGIGVAAAFDHFTSGMATTALFTLMMDASSHERAAADYTSQASVVVVAQTAAPVVAGFLAEWLGYGPAFVVAAGVGLLAVVVTGWVVSRARIATLLSRG